MKWKESVGGWQLEYARSYSTGLEGVNRILGGAMTEDFPTVETFISNIYSKGRSEGKL